MQELWSEYRPPVGDRRAVCPGKALSCMAFLLQPPSPLPPPPSRRYQNISAAFSMIQLLILHRKYRVFLRDR